MRVLFFMVQLFDGFDTTNDAVRGILSSMIQAAGFAQLQHRGTLETPVGTLGFVSAAKAAGQPP